MECLSNALAQREIKYTIKNKYQKNLIKFILEHDSLDLKYFAGLLGVDYLVLSQVAMGEDFLNAKDFKRLVDWFFYFVIT